MERLEKLLRERCPELELRRDEPMSRHTSFRIGGLNKRSVCADDFIRLYEDAFYYFVLLGGNVIFHFHCLINQKHFTCFDGLTGFYIYLNNAAAHRCAENFACDRFGRSSRAQC